MAEGQFTSALAPTRAPRIHVNLISVDDDRRAALFDRLDGDERFTLAERADRHDAEREVVALDVAGAEPHALELVRRLARRPGRPAVLALVQDEDDLGLVCALLMAGAAGIASLRQPASSLREAVVDLADGLSSVSAAIEAELLRQLQALPTD